jgi:hypothetical protein
VKPTRKNINSCSLIVLNDKKWKYVNLNPSPPNLNGLIKIHKQDAPIHPIVNWKDAPTYKLAKLGSDIIKHEIPLPYVFNVKNSIQLMSQLQELPYSHNIQLAFFGITNTYSNVLKTRLPQILTLVCNQQNTTKKFKREIIRLT